MRSFQVVFFLICSVTGYNKKIKTQILSFINNFNNQTFSNLSSEVCSLVTMYGQFFRMSQINNHTYLGSFIRNLINALEGKKKKIKQSLLIELSNLHKSASQPV